MSYEVHHNKYVMVLLLPLAGMFNDLVILLQKKIFVNSAWVIIVW